MSIPALIQPVADCAEQWQARFKLGDYAFPSEHVEPFGEQLVYRIAQEDGRFIVAGYNAQALRELSDV